MPLPCHSWNKSPVTRLRNEDAYRIVWLSTLLVFIFMSSPVQSQPVAGDERIIAIRFVGNERTKEQVMLQEMSIHVGDRVDRELVEKSRQSIMDLGLFKSVTAELLDESGGKVLQITVEERFFILPYPVVSAKPEGDYSYGFKLRFDNLAGLNQRLEVGYEHKRLADGEVPLRKETEIEYNYPRVIGTPYAFGISTKLVKEDLDLMEEDLQGKYKRDSYHTSLGVSRWLERKQESHGWFYGLGLNSRVDRYEYISGDQGLRENGQSIGITANLGYTRVHEKKYYRDGIAYGVDGELGVPELGSDYSYYRNNYYLRRYYPLVAEKNNLNAQLRLGLANGCNFDCEAFKLGGSSTLRGYENDYVTGNAFVLANIEYHHQISGYNQMRAVLFTDIGNAYPKPREIDLLDQKVSVGIGLRWRVQLFVDLTLRFDYGYGIDAKTDKVYLSTKAMF